MLECGEQWAPSPAVKRRCIYSWCGLQKLKSPPSLSFLRIAKKPRRRRTASARHRNTARIAHRCLRETLGRPREMFLCHAGAFLYSSPSLSSSSSTKPWQPLLLPPKAPASSAVVPASVGASTRRSCLLPLFARRLIGKQPRNHARAAPPAI